MNGQIHTFYAGCFHSTKIAKIDIPDSVNYFGRHTTENLGIFRNCIYLSTINIRSTSSLMNIGYSIAQYSGVTSFYVPASVNTIAPGAFNSMLKLKNLEVDNKNNVFCSIGDIIYSKDKTLLHTCAANKKTQIKFEDGVTQLAEEAFRTCQQRGELIVPETITEIPHNAFFMHNLIPLFYIQKLIPFQHMRFIMH